MIPVKTWTWSIKAVRIFNKSRCEIVSGRIQITYWIRNIIMVFSSISSDSYSWSRNIINAKLINLLSHFFHKWQNAESSSKELIIDNILKIILSVRWCSGYHVCFTRTRSPVRINFFLPFSPFDFWENFWSKRAKLFYHPQILSFDRLSILRFWCLLRYFNMRD